MAKPLVIVESPTKVRTLKKYLGGKYNIAATVGHIKDLPARELGIDIDNGFTPKYRTIPGKQKVVSALKKAAGETDEVFLAPDPDREGEAIAWHAAEVLKRKGRHFHRVLFHELTKGGISKAMANPEALNRSKYEAQQVRRILDRLVGYEISPLLWRKVKSGLSAGRVQSVAVRIICERERAIQVFEPVEYWSIHAQLAAQQPPLFEARLARKNGEKVVIGDEKTAMEIVDHCRQETFTVDKVTKRTTRRNPQPPFITSKLQQEAIRKLRFSAKRTMVVAQQLYEGIELGGGEPVGLITYMRTDSTRVSSEAAQEALGFIGKRFGEPYAENQPRVFRNRKKAQDAHEAIRPTAVARDPESLRPYLSRDQLALYTLIWKRFVASQMTPAQINNNSVRIACGDYQFNASGSTIKFPGFMKLYMSVDEEASQTKKSSPLPELKKGETLNLEQLTPKQHFTTPPPRFSEASLVKELEENGIGRPSTYAAILSTIRDKGYVDLLKGTFRPTELGFIVNDLIVDSFPEEFDVEFTAKMETDLDKVESNQLDTLKLLSKFYEPFRQRLDRAAENMRSMKAVGIPTGIQCPQCQAHDLHIKVGKNGHFLACSGYPECRYSRNYTRNEKGQIEPVEPAKQQATEKTCPRCDRPMVVKEGRYGPFLACTGYPECNHTESQNGGANGKATGVACPRSGCDGQLVERKSKRGKVFFGCNRYPKCETAMWEKPVPYACPACQAPFLVEKTTKRAGTQWICKNKDCGHQQLPEAEPDTDPQPEPGDM